MGGTRVAELLRQGTLYLAVFRIQYASLCGWLRAGMGSLKYVRVIVFSGIVCAFVIWLVISWMVASKRTNSLSNSP